jgi:hypothetical protein
MGSNGLEAGGGSQVSRYPRSEPFVGVHGPCVQGTQVEVDRTGVLVMSASSDLSFQVGA